MMRKLLKILLILSILALVPFGYFYYRDVISSRTLVDLGSCDPYNLEWEKEDEGLRVMWETKEDCIGYFRYATSSDEAGSIAVDVDGSGKKKAHTVEILEITEHTDYYLTFYSGDKTYGQAGRPIVISVD